MWRTSLPLCPGMRLSHQQCIKPAAFKSGRHGWLPARNVIVHLTLLFVWVLPLLVGILSKQRKECVWIPRNPRQQPHGNGSQSGWAGSHAEVQHRWLSRRVRADFAPSEISAACTCPHLDLEFPGQNHGSILNACQSCGTSTVTCFSQHSASKGLFVLAFFCAGSVPLLWKLNNQKALGGQGGGERGKYNQTFKCSTCVNSFKWTESWSFELCYRFKLFLHITT